MNTYIPSGFADTVPVMKKAHSHIPSALSEYGYQIPQYPKIEARGKVEGRAVAKAYPIQGILKYHGLTDGDWRTSYLPSVSVNNDAAYSITFVEFDPSHNIDVVDIEGRQAIGRDLERVQQSLDTIRSIAGITSAARVVSRNVVRATKTGKGLGTSASGSAALAVAAIAAAFGIGAVKDLRLLSCLSRLLAGSGCRSAVGGVSLWLSYPGIRHEDSFALRLDTEDQLKDISLITVPIDSRIGLKTELARQDAPKSTFFKSWMYSREDEITECIESVREKDWKSIGQLAELDSVRLYGTTMSGSRENKLFAWEPEDIYLFRMCNDLRSDGIPVYFSTDTGPTVVLITHRKYESDVVSRIESLNLGLEVVRGRIAGPAQLVALEDARTELNIS